jgi:hypothetical protein
MGDEPRGQRLQTNAFSVNNKPLPAETTPAVPAEADTWKTVRRNR